MLTFVALFLPLFPLSALLNLLLARLRPSFARSVLLLLWPQLGVTLLHWLQPEIPAFFVTWALLSAAFYALRLLTVRDLGQWAGLLASSALALTWGLATRGADTMELRLFVFWFSLPAALLILLSDPLAQRLGAAYAGLFRGLIEGQPRLAVVLTAVVLSAVATPPSPGFFALLGLLRGLSDAASLGILGIWLVWGWAAIRLLQGFVSGSGREIAAADLSRGILVTYVGALAAFVAAGLIFAGGRL